MLVPESKARAFIEKVNSRCFCWFPVDQNCPPLSRLHTKLCKGAWHVSANNSETVGYKDLQFGQIVCILVFYNISFSWLLPLDGFQFIFFYAVFIAWHWKRRIKRNSYSAFVPLSFSLHENAFDTEACALTGVHHRDVIVFKNVCFHPSTEYSKTAFSNISTLESALEKIRFRWPFSPDTCGGQAAKPKGRISVLKQRPDTCVRGLSELLLSVFTDNVCGMTALCELQ